MKSIIISPHSFIDVITNSSTEIYCNAKDKALDMVKEVINKILKDAGSNKTFEDLYEVGYVAGERCDRLDEDFEHYEKEDIPFTKKEFEKFKTNDFLTKKEYNKLNEYVSDQDDYGDYIDIKILSKNKEGENFIYMFDFFDINASMNG